MQNYPSRLLEDAVNAFASLPGVGKKSALRLVLHLLRQEPERVKAFSESFVKLIEGIRFCSVCHNISEAEKCTICVDNKRDQGIICVVQDLRDVLAIENTSQYRGVYHVLGGIISPIDGIGPGELNIDSLIARVSEPDVKEVIMALSTTMEGDTTVFYLYKKMRDLPVTVSTIARGVAIGDDLEFTDEVTLGRSILNRTPYENSLAR